MADTATLVKNLAETFGHPIRSPILDSPENYDLEFENIFFPSMDGIPLEAWWIPCRGSDKVVIANHPLWFNRYGFPAHLEPWKSIGAAGGNDFEVNFMRDYKHLHDAGHHVLCYDMRNFGHSGAANGGVGTNGIFESRDVVGSLQYIKHNTVTLLVIFGGHPAAAVQRVWNRLDRVRPRGVSAIQSAVRVRLQAMAVSTCWTCVLASPR